MAHLTEVERARTWRAALRRLSKVREPVAFTKQDLREAVDALDDFLEANAASINQALPTAFRTQATPGQKALLLSYVALRRYGDDPREA